MPFSPRLLHLPNFVFCRHCSSQPESLLNYRFNSFRLALERHVKKGQIGEIIKETKNSNLPLSKKLPESILLDMTKKIGFIDHNLSDKLIQELQKEFSIPIPIAVYNQLIRLFGKQKQISKCKEIEQRMKKEGVAPNAETYNIFIYFLTRSRHIEDALERFKQCKEKFEPKPETYDALLKYFSKKKEYDKVDCLIQEMEAKNIVSKNVLNSIQIKQLFSLPKEDKELALKITKAVESRGTLDRFSYNSYIACVCRGGDPPSPDSLLAHMKGQGMQPDLFSYFPLVKAFAKRMELNKVNILLRDMNKEGIKPNLTFSAFLLKFWIETKQNHKISSVFDRLHSFDIKPSIHLYNTMISAYCNSQNIEAARQELKNLPENISANYNSYNPILRAYIRSKDYPKASLLAEEMKEKKMEENEATQKLFAQIDLFYRNSVPKDPIMDGK